ncbi:hypothetical protein ACFYZN_21875 [Streptomyces sp. NPDC001777]|uniref:hypothetical protein n=1 Tax=Streptomyces sp. NPDC001777 TaxID=3364608 RepID=UPI0036CC02A0
MSDIYELVLAVDLRDELSEQEVAELRWHVGAGPQPEQLSIVTDFPFMTEDESGEWVVEDDPSPLLAVDGGAWRIGGALCSALVVRDEPPRKGWALTSRQEVHPDEFEKLGELLGWLAARAHHSHRLPDDTTVRLGYLRFYEDLMPDVLEVKDGLVVWPT